VGALVLTLWLLIGAPLPPAGAQPGESIDAMDVTLALEPSGDLRVREVIDYDFGGAEKRGIFRFIPAKVR
jgi:hypothetical protein